LIGSSWLEDEVARPHSKAGFREFEGTCFSAKVVETG
jgi:hypothetical protein